jgi:nitroreductase
MDINEAIIGRRSVREYTAEAVEERTIHSLIDAAMHAPSAMNQQLWAFTPLCVIRAYSIEFHVRRNHI